MSIIDGAGSAARKGVPLYSGLLKYFPDALVEVARLSQYGNDKHNPGQPLHWSKGKSNDHDDCILRHLLDAGRVDPDSGFRHRTMVAWRALAALQTEIEAGHIPAAKVEVALVERRKADRRVAHIAVAKLARWRREPHNDAGRNFEGANDRRKEPFTYD